jgi:hypothetical protein
MLRCPWGTAWNGFVDLLVERSEWEEYSVVYIEVDVT